MGCFQPSMDVSNVLSGGFSVVGGRRGWGEICALLGSFGVIFDANHIYGVRSVRPHHFYGPGRQKIAPDRVFGFSHFSRWRSKKGLFPPVANQQTKVAPLPSKTPPAPLPAQLAPIPAGPVGGVGLDIWDLALRLPEWVLSGSEGCFFGGFWDGGHRGESARNCGEFDVPVSNSDGIGFWITRNGHGSSQIGFFLPKR